LKTINAGKMTQLIFSDTQRQAILSEYFGLNL
jgi:hypothetical protein